MSSEDKKWLKRCLDNPAKYKIYVDNDMIFVVECTAEDPDGYDGSVYTFDRFGYDFALDLLEYMGANVDYV